MSRGPQTFRQRDVSAAIKAAKVAGCEVARVEVDKNGRIIVILANGKEQAAEKSGGCDNEWDDLK
jgi:hypothetical protein